MHSFKLIEKLNYTGSSIYVEYLFDMIFSFLRSWESRKWNFSTYTSRISKKNTL